MYLGYQYDTGGNLTEVRSYPEGTGPVLKTGETILLAAGTEGGPDGDRPPYGEYKGQPWMEADAAGVQDPVWQRTGEDKDRGAGRGHEGHHVAGWVPAGRRGSGKPL